MYYVIFGLLGAALLGADQWIKAWVVGHLQLGETTSLFPGFLELMRVHNYGAAWSSFAGQKWLLLGVTGGIACYKSAGLASALVKQGANVQVLMTRNATEFIGPHTFESLTGNRVSVDTFDRNYQFQVEHIALADQADLVLVAPATANVLAKLAHGLADDMLTNTVLA